MKRILITFVFMTIMFAVMVSCNDVDPIHGTQPVDPTWWSGAHGNIFPLEQFKRLGQTNDTSGQRKLLNEYRTQLTKNVLVHYPNLKDEKSIHFYLGSGYAKDVMSGDGNTYSGKFKNELIIIINDENVKDTVFLACGNGMLSPLKFDDYHDFGVATPWRITILPGQGLAHYFPTLQAWAKVAGDCYIPIKNQYGKLVSQDTYLHYLGMYQSLLFPYDVIDLVQCKVYDQNGKQVNFQKRLDATKEANKKNKKRRK